MSVPIKPHYFRLFTQSPTTDVNHVVDGFQPSSPGLLVRGCAQQVSPNASYDIFGREVTDGFAFYFDATIDNIVNSEVGGRIEWDGNPYAIEKVQTNYQNLPSDHIAVYAVKTIH